MGRGQGETPQTSAPNAVRQEGLSASHARKFYRTLIEVEVLSEKEPVSDGTDLAGIAYEITDGEWSGDISIKSVDELTPEEAAKALEKQGSDPDFFMLDNDGRDLLDEDE